MDFRTEVKIEPQRRLIDYSTPVMFIGSCFSGEMASKMKEGLMPVLSNPTGVVYNPVSVSSALRSLIAGKIFTEDDLWFHNGKWLSFAHYTDFSDDDRDICLERINRVASEASGFIKRTGFLFITFGTARIYRRVDTGEAVSNCHKIPASFFSRELLSVSSIVKDWSELIEELYRFNPDLSVIFTISPVRHWKDGAHGNQVSKSVLFLAVEELQKIFPATRYFPSYELLLDDLRDYRFYADDMLHPSDAATDYIWKKFSGACLDSGAGRLWKEISEISKASRHRITSRSGKEIESFADTMLGRIKKLESAGYGVDLSSLREYFLSLKH
ncbi:MAG: GSCFA domain-containing protein [Bacteroidales bacterium]